MINNWKHIYICLFVIIAPVLMAQQVVTGQITDAADGTPVAGASIFVANTTIGTASDISGNYSFTVPGRGSFEIVVSHVSYQSVFHKVEIPQDAHQFDVALEINELEEVTVRAAKTYKKSDVDLFWRRILGEKPSKNGMEVLSPEKIYFYKSGNILKASCREPIEIINRHTGYHIRYVLQRFEHNYQTNETELYGMSSFDELIPRNSREEAQWAKKRQEVYAVSLNRFLRALYRKQIREEGFVLADQNTETNDGKLLPVRLEDMVTIGKEGALFDINNPLYLLCYSKPVTNKMISELYRNNIFYDEPAYISGIGGFVTDGLATNVRKGGPVAWGILPSQITVFADGTYSGLLRIREYDNSLTALSSMLPVEYNDTNPNNSFSLADLPPLSFYDQVEENLTAQLEAFPQEKIYLHTDKPYYLSGERIWFRAHLADAATHAPATASRYVYVELINPLDTVVALVKILQDKGTYHGHLFIPADSPEGDYTIRAHTAYMRNLDEEYFCTKSIRIGDPQAYAVHTESKFVLESGGQDRVRVYATFRFSQVSSDSPLIPKSVKVKVNNGREMDIMVDDDSSVSFNFDLPAASRQRTILLDATVFTNPYRQFIRIPMTDDDFDVSFYPEGGSIMSGAFGKVAFKAMKSNGQATEISGVLYDRDGVEILNFSSEHLGMGHFSFTAEKGKTYYAVCENNKGQSKRFDLPAAVERGYSLAVNPLENRIYVSTLQPANATQSDELYLFAHTRGQAHFLVQWNHGQNIYIQPDQFPAGVLHLILFDAGLNMISERLVFNNNPNDQAQVTYRQDQENFVRRSLVNNLVSITDRDGEPLSGSFSVAVTSDSEVSPDSTSNILTHLLLTSDLRGNIENPACYFRDAPSSARDLDLLMLTQGWRRYNMAELVQGRITQPTIPIETGQIISGTVQSLLLGNPVKDIDVNVLSSEYGYFDSVKTDRDGRFYFYGGEFPDSTEFIVHAVQRRGMTSSEVTIDDYTFPERTLSVVPAADIDRNLFAKYVNKADMMYISENGMRVYDLPEVTVMAPRIQTRESVYYEDYFVNHIITKEDIKSYNPIDIYAVLQTIPGVQVIKNGYFDPPLILFRGAGMSSFLNPIPPTVVVDNVKWELDDLQDLPVSIVTHVDALKDFNPFGGAGGAIVIYTDIGSKDDEPMRPNYHIKNIMPLGYQQPVEFYAPKYDTPEKRNTGNSDLRTTIHWQPVVQTNSDGVASFGFYTADEPSSYSVVIEGLTDDGKIVRQVEKIQVK